MTEITSDTHGKPREFPENASSSVSSSQDLGALQTFRRNASRRPSPVPDGHRGRDQNLDTVFTEASKRISHTQSAEQIREPRNTRALVADIELRGMTAVIHDIQNRCEEISEPRRMLDTRDDGKGDPKPMLGALAAALTLDRYKAKYPDLTIVPTSAREPHGATPENLERMEAALGAGRPVFAALDFCLSHTQLVGLFPEEDQDQSMLQAFNFDSIGGTARRDAIDALLRGLPTQRAVVIDGQTFPRQVNYTGCRAEALVFAKDFYLSHKDGPGGTQGIARTLDTLKLEGRVPKSTLRVAERRDFLSRQDYQERTPYRYKEGRPVPGKELGDHRRDHTSAEGENLFHHAKTLSYVEHAFHYVHQQSHLEGSTLAEVAETSLARHFGPNARKHLEALLSTPPVMRRVEALSNMQSHFPSQLGVNDSTGHEDVLTGASADMPDVLYGHLDDDKDLGDTSNFF